ncbi:hypothetical protein F7725_022016 [Dissostichus mawsoni]|uniref:Nuclear transcription factor Y subunit beta n=1 Tax=Dissostichus mawsoni TaxID=36200 RepID=A0A7J5ZG52_DISMA|nr:hypothetical protein F7725_022016 [Dissostichus mawsoni]
MMRCVFVLQMDGDNSTTDASQLGITGEYMASGHYVLQSQEDDGEENMNDHDDSGIKENFREQDIYLPIANVARIMKNAECVSEFISFITSEASERCHQEKRKTINGEDILFAMSTLGFDMGEGDSWSFCGRQPGDDLTDESFSNPMPAGIITADGQQQNVMVFPPYNRSSFHDEASTRTQRLLMTSDPSPQGKGHQADRGRMYREITTCSVESVVPSCEGFASRPASHGHVVLCGCAGGQGVHGGRVAQSLVLRHCSSGAVSDHESRVQTSVLNQEGRQVAERRVHQTLRPALAHRGQLILGPLVALQGFRPQRPDGGRGAATGHPEPLAPNTKRHAAHRAEK